MASQLDEVKYYNKPVWRGVVFFWVRMPLLERGLYVCHARGTDFHALPIPQVYAPVDGEIWVETSGWTAHLESGEKLCLPVKDGRQKNVIGWTPWVAKNKLVPGQLTIVKNDFLHRLVGEGRLALLYPSPDSPEGQRLFTRGDFDRGLAVVTPPAAIAKTLTAGLSELLDGRPEWPEEAATFLYQGIVDAVAPADRLQVWPAVVGAVVRDVRHRCRLRRLQCELNTRATLKEIVAYIGRREGIIRTPHWLEKLFREYLASTITRLKVFLRLSAAMEYYAALAREARWSSEYVEPSMTELAAEVHYPDEAQFCRDFRRFHGISPVAFFRGAKFYVIEMDQD